MAHHKAESVPKGMEKHLVDRSLVEKAFINIASLESQVKGYILNCRCEGKSQAPRPAEGWHGDGLSRKFRLVLALALGATEIVVDAEHPSQAIAVLRREHVRAIGS